MEQKTLTVPFFCTVTVSGTGQRQMWLDCPKGALTLELTASNSAGEGPRGRKMLSACQPADPAGQYILKYHHVMVVLSPCLCHILVSMCLFNWSQLFLVSVPSCSLFLITLPSTYLLLFPPVSAGSLSLNVVYFLWWSSSSHVKSASCPAFLDLLIKWAIKALNVALHLGLPWSVYIQAVRFSTDTKNGKTKTIAAITCANYL